MVLNNVEITNKALLTRYFIPFEEVWNQAQNSMLYQEFLKEYCDSDPLLSELLSAARRVVSPDIVESSTATFPLSDLMRASYPVDLKEFYWVLQDGNEAQKNILYLGILMHLHAEQPHITKEALSFIRGLLEKKAQHVPVSDNLDENGIFRSRLAWIEGTAYHLNADGQITSLETNQPLKLAAALTQIVSFAYTPKLGLIAADKDGNLHLSHSSLHVSLPTGTKIAAVSAYLSNYILLSTKGQAFTNVLLHHPEEWTHLSYVYAGLNSICGIKKGSGTIVSEGMSKLLSPYSDVARICTYRGDGQYRYILLHKNGTIEIDEEDKSTLDLTAQVNAIAISHRGYAYALGNRVMFQPFDAPPSSLSSSQLILSPSAKENQTSQFTELAAKDGKICCE
jgi:hypothetical protein